MAKKKELVTEKALLQKLWDFTFGMSTMRATIGLCIVVPHNPEGSLKDIEKAQYYLKKLWAYHHPEYLDEEKVSAMCDQLDNIGRRIYVAYASCKATGLTELYVKNLSQLFQEAHDVMSPIYENVDSNDLFDTPEYLRNMPHTSYCPQLNNIPRQELPFTIIPDDNLDEIE